MSRARTSLLLRAGLLSVALLTTAAPTIAAPAPATTPAAGVWCGAGLLHKYMATITQEIDRVHATLRRRDRERVYEITGRMDGAVLHADAQRGHTMDLLVQGDELRIQGGTGLLALAKGQYFTRSATGACGR